MLQPQLFCYRDKQIIFRRPQIPIPPPHLRDVPRQRKKLASANIFLVHAQCLQSSRKHALFSLVINIKTTMNYMYTCTYVCSSQYCKCLFAFQLFWNFNMTAEIVSVIELTLVSHISCWLNHIVALVNATCKT